MKFIDYHLLTCLLTLSLIFYPIFDSLYGAKVNLTLKGKIIKEITNTTPDYDFVFLPPLQNKGFFESIDDLSICRNRNVRKFIYLYLTDGKEYLTSAIKRSNRYYNEISELFDTNTDIPKDIALLPLLESAFNPYAVSRSRATGMWQIIHQTSVDLNLKVNSYVDERRNVKKSTLAAIRHFRNLYSIFGSWELSLAAYNGGAGYIKWAMRKSNSTNIHQLLNSNILVKETNEYLYRYAALLVIYKNQRLFDIDTQISEADFPETDFIELEYPVRIQTISEITGVKVQELRNLNPELNQDITPPYENLYQFIIPREFKVMLKNNPSQLYSIKYDKLKRHVVKEGECISHIAAAYKTDTKKIFLLNNLKSSKSIRPGQELYIPFI